MKKHVVLGKEIIEMVRKYSNFQPLVWALYEAFQTPRLEQIRACIQGTPRSFDKWVDAIRAGRQVEPYTLSFTDVG